MSKIETNLFETATRAAFRYKSTRGEISTEQLWQVPLRAGDGFNLDEVARAVNSDLKSVTEESFVATHKTAAQDVLEAKLEVVKHVIATKLEEEVIAKNRAAAKLEKARLLEVLAEKQDGKLSRLSEAELKKRIAALDEAV